MSGYSFLNSSTRPVLCITSYDQPHSVILPLGLGAAVACGSGVAVTTTSTFSGVLCTILVTSTICGFAVGAGAGAAAGAHAPNTTALKTRTLIKLTANRRCDMAI